MPTYALDRSAKSGSCLVFAPSNRLPAAGDRALVLPISVYQMTAENSNHCH